MTKRIPREKNNRRQSPPGDEKKPVVVDFYSGTNRDPLLREEKSSNYHTRSLIKPLPHRNNRRKQETQLKCTPKRQRKNKPGSGLLSGEGFNLSPSCWQHWYFAKGCKVDTDAWVSLYNAVQQARLLRHHNREAQCS